MYASRALRHSPESEGVNSLESTHGKPRRIRIDNGPEYRSHKLALWAKENAIELQLIQPGKPTQNSYIERFKGTYRTEVLNSFLFDSLQQVWNETEKFQFKYNNQRPHGVSSPRKTPYQEPAKSSRSCASKMLTKGSSRSSSTSKSRMEFTSPSIWGSER